jgi:hypothetical protein
MKVVNKLLIISAAAVSLAQTAARAQLAELGDVSLLTSFDGSVQSAVLEIVNKSDHEISSLAISCQLLNDAGKAIAVKVVRFRHLPPGSVTGDAAFPTHVRGVDAACHILHQSAGQVR